MIRRVCRRIGFDVVRYKPTFHPGARRRALFESFKIDTVLDVGANTGQYGKYLRNVIGYKGRIISFEPLSSAYGELTKTANADGLWKAMNCALGNTNEKNEINIAANSLSSSILEMLPSHVKSAPESKYIGKEQIEVITLDSIFEDICSKEESILLKIDTQGYERFVIEGATNSLAFIDTIQLEMSLIPLYQDELLFNEMYQVLYQRGYRMVSIEPEFLDDRTGQVLQVDCIFHRF
jgi:FkbM family methyltransferase